MREHIKLLGILNIVWSSISIAIGLVVLLAFGGLAGFLGVIGYSTNDGNNGGLMVAPFMAILGVAIVTLICAVSLPALIGGIGLLQFKSWARLLMIIVSIFHLPSFPFGTALGVYGLWVLFHDEARQILEGRSALPTPPPPQSPIVPV